MTFINIFKKIGLNINNKRKSTQKQNKMNLSLRDSGDQLTAKVISNFLSDLKNSDVIKYIKYLNSNREITFLKNMTECASYNMIDRNPEHIGVILGLYNYSFFELLQTLGRESSHYINKRYAMINNILSLSFALAETKPEFTPVIRFIKKSEFLNISDKKIEFIDTIPERLKDSNKYFMQIFKEFKRQTRIILPTFYFVGWIEEGGEHIPKIIRVESLI